MTNPQFQSSHSTNLESIVDHSAWFSNSARVRESKTVLDYGFRQFVASGTWILDSGFWILDSGFWIRDSGFWIRIISGIPDSESWIPDSSQDPVVRKPIGTNPWLNFNPGVFFSLSIAPSRIISSIPVLESSSIKL